MDLIGDKSNLAFEIGDFQADSIQQQNITVWVGGKRLNPIDSVVYLPTFYTKLQNEIKRLNREDFACPDVNNMTPREAFDFLDEREGNDLHQVLVYDVTTCPATCFFYQNKGEGNLLFSYWDPRHKPPEEIGQVFENTISKSEFVGVLSEAIKNLSDEWV